MRRPQPMVAHSTAGPGTVLNYRFEQLATIIDAVGGHPRCCVCLDTCHIFAAGYDIRTKETYAQTFEEFDRLVGCDRIKAIHCNDSKHELGTRRDRHEHLGDGFIGKVAVDCRVNDNRCETTPRLVQPQEPREMH